MLWNGLKFLGQKKMYKLKEEEEEEEVLGNKLTWA